MKPKMEERAEFGQEILGMPRRRVMFTHSDPMSRNILVNDDNIVVAILDCEMPGWMPEQWEYVKAMWGVAPR